MIDELDGLPIIESDFNQRLVKWFGLLILCAILFLTILMLVTAGCVTASKEVYHGIVGTPTPIPTPTEEPTPESEVTEETPEPVVTEDPVAYMLRTNGYKMRQYHQWFRPDVQGINGEGKKDLHTLATVYNYKFMESYHWYSVSWARKFVVKPDDRADQFLFIFANIYSDDTGNGAGDDVRQYALGCDNFAVQVDDRVYTPDYMEYPERRITEFDDMWDFGHVTYPGPLGYRIVQEAGSGIIMAEMQEWLMGGRSNAHDGYCIFQVPRKDSQGNPVNATNTKALGNFGTFGQVWWQLE